MSLVAESHCNHACAGGLEPNRESFMLAARCGGADCGAAVLLNHAVCSLSVCHPIQVGASSIWPNGECAPLLSLRRTGKGYEMPLQRLTLRS